MTFGTNTTLTTGLTFNLGGTPPVPAVTLQSTGVDRSLTLGGDVTVTGSNTSSITIGSTTTGQQLIIDLGGSDRLFTVDTGNSLAVLNVIGGSNSLTKAGAATPTFSGDNSYTGITTVNAGVLSFSGALSGATGAANFVLNGGTLRYTGPADTNGALTLGTTPGSAFDASGPGTLTLDNTGALVLSGTNTARTFTLTGTGGGSLAPILGNNGTGATSLTKAGAGTWTLAGTSTYTLNSNWASISCPQCGGSGTKLTLEPLVSSAEMSIWGSLRCTCGFCTDNITLFTHCHKCGSYPLVI